jgi:hypothetical protein
VAFCAACATSWLSAASVVSCCHTAEAASAAGVVESTENPTQEQEHQSARFPRQETFLSGESGTLAHKHVCRNFKVPNSLEHKLCAPGNRALWHISMYAGTSKCPIP